MDLTRIEHLSLMVERGALQGAINAYNNHIAKLLDRLKTPRDAAEKATLTAAFEGARLIHDELCKERDAITDKIK